MHIPDGFLSPQTYLPAVVIGTGLLMYAYKKVALDVEKIPMLSGVSAIAFVMMLIIIPVPGGTTVHLSGIAIIALLFNPWISFMSISLVLLIQALMFGDGGVSAYPINMLSLAFLGSFSAYYGYKIFKNISEKFAIIFAGWISVALPSVFIATALGIQPLIATSQDGSPLFFPFGLELTIPSIVIPHMLLGLLEGFIAFGIINFLKTRFKRAFDE